MIKNVIFDWSGVIKDAVEGQLWIVNKIFAEFGVKEISLQEFKANWEQPYMPFYHKYLPNITFEEEQAAYRKNIVGCPPAKQFPGISDVIKDWHKKGIKMSVVSSDFPETLLEEIDIFGLNDIFVDIATDVYDKQSAIEEIIKKHGFNKLETVVIGDSNHEIEAGQGVGIKTAAVTWGFCREEVLAILKPDFIFHNLNELKSLIH